MKRLIYIILKKFGFVIYNESKRAKQLVKEKWKFFRSFDIRSIIDVGANEGQFIKEILDQFPGAEVYTFEPLQDSYERLVSNFKNNNKVHTFNLALGDEEGEIIIRRSDATASSSILTMSSLHKKIYPYTANINEQKVRITRLDSILENVNTEGNVLLKIDVQGAEEKVIKGAINILKKTDIIICEVSYVTLYETQPLFKDILSLLEQHGFFYIGNVEQFTNPATNVPLYADAIFVKQKIYRSLYTS